MQTWNVFTSSDVALAFLGFSGLIAVVAVLATAFRNVEKRENQVKGRSM